LPVSDDALDELGRQHALLAVFLLRPTAPISLVWCMAFGLAGHALGSNWESVHQVFRDLDCLAVAAVLGIAVFVIARVRRTP